MYGIGLGEVTGVITTPWDKINVIFSNSGTIFFFDKSLVIVVWPMLFSLIFAHLAV